MTTSPMISIEGVGQPVGQNAAGQGVELVPFGAERLDGAVRQFQETLAGPAFAAAPAVGEKLWKDALSALGGFDARSPAGPKASAETLLAVIRENLAMETPLPLTLPDGLAVKAADAPQATVAAPGEVVGKDGSGLDAVTASGVAAEAAGSPVAAPLASELPLPVEKPAAGTDLSVVRAQTAATGTVATTDGTRVAEVASFVGRPMAAGTDGKLAASEGAAAVSAEDGLAAVGRYDNGRRSSGRPAVRSPRATAGAKAVRRSEAESREMVATLPTAPLAAPVNVVETAPAVGVQPVGSTVAASVNAKVEAVSNAQVLIEAAEAVAETIMVSPGLLRGDGEVSVRLKPDVLQGTQIRVVSESGRLTVSFLPTVESMALMLERCQGQLVQHLATHVPSVRIAVKVKKVANETV